jgi:catechol 2,3-dioxygenase-like lactoylglutathione lyase family enzyme
MERAVGFYCDVLNATVQRRNPKGTLTQLRAGSCQIDISPVPAGQPLPDQDNGNMGHFCIRIEPWDAAALITHLNKNGVKTDKVESRFGADGRGPSLYIQDPDGNTIELKGPPVSPDP